MISKEEKEGAQAAALLAIPGGIALLIGGTILSGFVLSILWGWFLVPLGIPAITLAQAIGVSIVGSLLTKQHQSQDNEGPKDAITKLAAECIARPLLALFFGWIVTLFM